MAETCRRYKAKLQQEVVDPIASLSVNTSQGLGELVQDRFFTRSYTHDPYHTPGESGKRKTFHSTARKPPRRCTRSCRKEHEVVLRTLIEELLSRRAILIGPMDPPPCVFDLTGVCDRPGECGKTHIPKPLVTCDKDRERLIRMERKRAMNEQKNRRAEDPQPPPREAPSAPPPAASAASTSAAASVAAAPSPASAQIIRG